MGDLDNKKSGFSIFADFLGNVASRSTSLIVERSKEVLKDKMKKGFKAMFIKSLIKYFIVFASIFLVIFEPFRYFFSHLIASLSFLFVLVWSIISVAKVIKEYYKLIYFVIKDKSIENGTWDFIDFKWPAVAKGITGYNLVRKVGSLLSENFNNMPDVKTTVKDFLRYVLKDVIIFFSFFLLYLITINFIVKPFLIESIAGIKTWEIYLFPVIQIKNFITHLFL